MHLPTFDLYHTTNEQIDIVLHGGSKGKDSAFIQKLVNRSKQEGRSVLALDFPYLTRGGKPSDGLIDEAESLKSILKVVKALGYEKIHFVAKSLGGIVASKVLNDLPETEQSQYSITIYGYAMPYIHFDKFTGSIVVVHGDNDRHGSMEEVNKSLANSPSNNKTVITIEGADHSYNKEDTKENEAIEAGYKAMLSNYR